MKELSTEEKARAYDEALERAKERYSACSAPALLEYIFPELKESDDEKIIKGIKSLLEHYKESGEAVCPYPFVSIKDCIAWLEKHDGCLWMPTEEQFEALDYAYNSCSDTERGNYYEGVLEGLIEDLHKLQEKQNNSTRCQSEVTKTSDQELEPKSKVSQWIVDNESKDVFLIKSFNSGYCTLEDIKGNIFSPCELPFEEDCHLWTIDDAKDGDVLWHSDSASNGIFIFKEIRNDGKVLCYCDYDSEDGFCLGESHTCCWTDSKILHPATKEQRNLLFQKMKEAGYEWDNKNKELKKK